MSKRCGQLKHHADDEENGLQIGRFKVRMLMRERNSISKQPGFRAHKKATVERPDIRNVPDREFIVAFPNEVWCGGHYVRMGRRSMALSGSGHHLYARQVVGWAFSAKPDADLMIKALDMAYEQRGRPQNVLFHSNQGSQYGSRSFR